jgi:hypothetical protein
MIKRAVVMGKRTVGLIKSMRASWKAKDMRTRLTAMMRVTLRASDVKAGDTRGSMINVSDNS